MCPIEEPSVERVIAMSMNKIKKTNISIDCGNFIFMAKALDTIAVNDLFDLILLHFRFQKRKISRKTERQKCNEFPVRKSLAICGTRYENNTRKKIVENIIIGNLKSIFVTKRKSFDDINEPRIIEFNEN